MLGIGSSGLSGSETSKAESSSNDASALMVKSDLFTKRDEGLACFNILDHLRQGAPLQVQMQQQLTSEDSCEGAEAAHDGEVRLE